MTQYQVYHLQLNNIYLNMIYGVEITILYIHIFPEFSRTVMNLGH